MTTVQKEKIARRKLSLLQLAQELGDASHATRSCRRRTPPLSSVLYHLTAAASPDPRLRPESPRIRLVLGVRPGGSAVRLVGHPYYFEGVRR